MTSFIGANAHSSPAGSSEIHFRISSASDADILARITAVFAKLAVLPNAFHMERREDQFHMDIRVSDISQVQAEHIAQTLRQIIMVETVLVDVREITEIKASA